MKKYLLVLATMLPIFFCSCVTTKMDTYGVTSESAKDYDELDPKVYKAEDENLSVSAVSFDSGRWLRLSFTNKSDKSITVISDLVQFFGKSREYTTRLIPGETRRIMDASTIPNFMIPPSEKIEKEYTSKDHDNYDASHFVYKSKISYIAVSYKIGSEEKYLKVPDINIKEDFSAEGIKVGTVESNWIFIHPLFIQLTDSNREKLYNRALEKAQNKYGNDVYLANLVFDGSWNPLSLLLYFDALGFVEKGTLTADVYKK